MPQLQDASSELAEKFTALSPERQSALLQKMTPDQKANLHSALQAHVAREAAPTTATQPVSTPETPGAFKRAASSYFQNLLPSTNAGDYLYPFAHPIDAISNLPLVGEAMLNAQGDQLNKAVQAKDWGGRIAHGLGYAIPVIGPPLAEAGEQMRNNDVAGGLGSTAGIATALFGPEVVKKIPVPEVVTPGFLRRRAQTMIGAQPEGVTKPLVEAQVADIAKHHDAMGEHGAKTRELTAEHAGKQFGTNALTEMENQATTEKAFRKAGETKAAFDKRVADQNAAHAAKVQAVEAANAEARRVANLRTQGEQSLKAGHQAVGESIDNAEKLVRQEGNEKWDVVRAGIGSDGADPGRLANSVDFAQKNIIKGSPESIKPFKSISSAAGSISEANRPFGVDLEAMKNAGEVKTPDGRVVVKTPAEVAARANEIQKLMDAIRGGGTDKVPFDQLHGWSQEVAAQMAKGGLPADIYNALKHVQGTLKEEMQALADRNGVGPQLTDANAHWSAFKDTFHNPDSAVAKALNNVGVKDPQFYAEPFTTGKSAQVGANKLRGVNPDGTPNALATSRHASELNQIADAAMQLRDTHAQIKGLPNLKESPLPASPKPIAKPKTVEVEYKGPTEVPPPKLPAAPEAPAALTPEDIARARRDKAYAKSVSIGQASKWDFATAGISTGLKQLLSGAFASDRFVDFVSKPTSADLKWIGSLPEPQRAQLRASLQQAIGQSAKAGSPVAVSPSLAKVLGITSATVPKTAGEARERLRSIQ